MAGSKTFGLSHLALAVKDVGRTLGFYQSVFDMQVMYHERGFVQLTTPGCYDILVYEEKTDNAIGETGGNKWQLVKSLPQNVKRRFVHREPT